MGLTREIAAIVANASLDAVPEASLRTARHCLLDWFGVTLAGLDEPLSGILRETYAQQSDAPAGGDAAIIGTSFRAPAHDAALINGATSHALDYDDVSAMGHPTAPILPAVLAIAEAEKRSGRDLLVAFIAGYEAAGLIAAQAMPSHYTRGFHSTGTIGAFGAAAAAARLLGLDEEDTAVALGLAGTQAAGLKSMFGTMAKPFHAGKAAANGVIAATLAARGFEARRDVLETDQGFFTTQTDASPIALKDYSFGKWIRRNLFKYHAACYLTQSSIEAIAQIRREQGIDARHVEAVRIHVPAAHLGVCNIESPTTGLETKFSLRHCAAYTLAGDETASIETYNDANANRPDLVALRERVVVLGDLGPGTHAEVEIELTSRETIARREDVGIPAVDQGQEEAALRAKFAALTKPVLGASFTELADLLLEIDTIDDISRLLEAARPSRPR